MRRKNTAGQPPAEVVAAAVQRGDRLIAATTEGTSGDWVVVTRWQAAVVAPSGELRWARPWRDVDAGSWDPESDLLSITWVDGSTAVQWHLPDALAARPVVDAFWDRVQASVVLLREVDLGGNRTARVAVRKDLRTRELSDQVLWGRGAADDDVELAEAVAVARATLRDQSGLPPHSS